MENRQTEEEGLINLAKEGRLLTRIIGFFLIFYGIISFIDPNRYGFGLSSVYSTLFSLLLMIVGLFLITAKGDKHGH